MASLSQFYVLSGRGDTIISKECTLCVYPRSCFLTVTQPRPHPPRAHGGTAALPRALHVRAPVRARTRAHHARCRAHYAVAQRT
ncbi:hypothetical protein EON67_06625 [archaeon]|nr:MAG: hypothetical protein EON67_06625 [archaeon]